MWDTEQIHLSPFSNRTSGRYTKTLFCRLFQFSLYSFDNCIKRENIKTNLVIAPAHYMLQCLALHITKQVIKRVAEIL